MFKQQESINKDIIYEESFEDEDNLSEAFKSTRKTLAGSTVDV